MIAGEFASWIAPEFKMLLLKLSLNRTKLHLKRNDGDVMKSTIDFQKEEYEALMKVLGLDNGESTDEENDTDKYFDAWNFGRTDEDSNFFATATLT